MVFFDIFFQSNKIYQNKAIFLRVNIYRHLKRSRSEISKPKYVLEFELLRGQRES